MEPVVVRSTPTVAVRREIDYLRRAGIQGERLLEELLRIYQQHRRQDRYQAGQRDSEERAVPQIVCSMALV